MGHRRRDKPICTYCRKPARFVDGKLIGGKHVRVWICVGYPKCDAYVMCHPGTKRPLGTLANRELRLARRDAHDVFDRTWKGRRDRNKAYAWLAAQLGIARDACHIGLMDLEQCLQVIVICRQFTPVARRA